MIEKRSLFASKAAMLPLALIAMFFWGSLFPMIKVGYQTFQLDTSSPANIMLFAGIRFITCGLLLVGSLGAQKKTMSPPKKTEMFPVMMIQQMPNHLWVEYRLLPHLLMQCQKPQRTSRMTI